MIGPGAGVRGPNPTLFISGSFPSLRGRGKANQAGGEM